MTELPPSDALTYDESRHFEPGFNDVYCKCSAHLSYHANRACGTPFEKYRDPKFWFCPVNPPREWSLFDIAMGMRR